MILLVVAGGLTLHRREHRGWAGVLLALLALKPQMAVGLVLWMLLGAISACWPAWRRVSPFSSSRSHLLGPGVWLNYFHAMPAISAVTRSAHFSPLMEASLTGMASNLLFAAGLPAWETPAMKLTYAVTVSARGDHALPRGLDAAAVIAGQRARATSRDRELRVCLRCALHDARAALFHRLRPDADGGAAGPALADAVLAMGRGPLRRLDRSYARSVA